MYTVHMERECGCFQRSEFESQKSFENQQDAYNYANIAAEIMSEDFCGKHIFVAQKIDGNDFVIRMTDNPHGGSCGTGSSTSSCSTGSCGCN
ncbi:MAG: hypothetical protein JXQ67_07995 [Campylobacterales bacterium]|nr:hypothetical protein [Campylobacterales bacterium]